MGEILLLSRFFMVHTLLVAGGLLALAMETAARRWPGWLSARERLKIHYAMLTLVGILPLLTLAVPQNHRAPGSARIWAAQAMAVVRAGTVDGGPSGSVATAFSDERYMVPLAWIADGLWLCLGVGVLLLMLAGLREMAKRRAIRSGSHPIRKIGSVWICLSDLFDVPFVCWFPGSVRVVLPAYLLERPEHFRIALRHELQHHRQGDTRWVYLVGMMRLLFYCNPLVHLWARYLFQTREYACDEEMVGRKGLTPRAYGQCLLDVARRAGAGGLPSGAVGMAISASGLKLKRRIEQMFRYPNSNRKRRFQPWPWLGVLAFMSFAAWASHNWIQDRRLTLAQAQALAAQAARSNGFVVKVNEEVLAELNRYLGTPDGRRFVRQAMSRMEHHRARIEGELQRSRLPESLLAVPFVESGFRNIPSNADHPNFGAGIWQLIPGTARRLDLVVDGGTDERMDTEKATRAALRFLNQLHDRFESWDLAMLGYNLGEAELSRRIETLGTRDPWRLTDAGKTGDPHYLAKVLAAYLILKNPEVAR